MARYYRRRYYRRRRSGRWSSNIDRIKIKNTIPSDLEAGKRYTNSYTLVQNVGQSSSRVSSKYTIKNVEIAATFDVTAFSQYINNVEYYIIYVPQGYTISQDLPIEHPEWIMSYKFVGSAHSMIAANNSESQVPKIKTRLSRKLNTGDSIIFLYSFTVDEIHDSAFDFLTRGLARWWTKTN